MIIILYCGCFAVPVVDSGRFRHDSGAAYFLYVGVVYNIIDNAVMRCLENINKISRSKFPSFYFIGKGTQLCGTTNGAVSAC